MTEERSAVIKLSGDLDLLKRDAIAQSLPSPTDIDRLIIDCSEVTSIESVVIAVFMRYRRGWIAAGRDSLNMVFLVPPAIRRTFEIAGVSEWFTLVSN